MIAKTGTMGVVALLLGLATACGSDAEPAATSTPSPTRSSPTSTPSPTSTQAAPFPTSSFAAINEDPVTEELATLAHHGAGQCRTVAGFLRGPRDGAARNSWAGAQLGHRQQRSLTR